MKNKFFRLRPSYSLAILLLIVHGGAIACLCFLPWFWWVKLLLAFVCLMSFVTFFCQYVLLNSPDSIVEFCLQNGGRWQLMNSLHQIKTVKLEGNSICTRSFVLLNFRTLIKPIGYIRILILPDSLDAKDFRRLRRQLRSVF